MTQQMYLQKVSEAFSVAPWAADIIAIAALVGFVAYVAWGWYYYNSRTHRSPFESL